MILGACRGLVAVLLVLGLLPHGATPALGQDSPLRVKSVKSTYSLQPSKSRVTVNVRVILENPGSEPLTKQTWSLSVEDGARVAGAKWGPSKLLDPPEVTPVEGPWDEATITLKKIPPNQERSFNLTYRLAGGEPGGSEPFRLGATDSYFCVPRQAGEGGSIFVKTPASHAIASSGTPMTREFDENVATGGTITYRSSGSQTELTCFFATEEAALLERSLKGPDGREMVLQAGPENEVWLTVAQTRAERSLPELRRTIGHPIPGTGPVIVRQGPDAGIAGYAPTHADTDLVRLSYDVSTENAPHQLAHAWFGADRFPETWLREGLVRWAGSSGSCELPPGGIDGQDLSEWEIVRPSAPADVEARIERQEQAACAVVAAVAARMGPEAMQTVVGAMLNAEEKYVAGDRPGEAPSPLVDWREWLDAVDERGLVPAGDRELDFAQSLLASVGVAGDATLLQQRSEARQAYHALLERSAPLAAPAYVRTAMDEWRFDEALAGMTVAADVLGALTEGTDMLPEAGLVKLLQPRYEGSGSREELEGVKTEAVKLLAAAAELLPLLTRLSEGVQPWSWKVPGPIEEAVTAGRFVDAGASIGPALAIVDDLRAAEAALPGSDLHSAFRTRFEMASSRSALESLSVSVAELRDQALSIKIDLDALGVEAGGWTLPKAVSEPLARGQVSSAYTAIRDARAVVQAVTEARGSLAEAELEDVIRPRYEAAASLDALRALAEEAAVLRDQAVATGGALGTLRADIGDWRLPTVFLEPIKARDFARAQETIGEGQAWIDAAQGADEALPNELDAVASQRTAFEGASSIEDLQAGREVAKRQEQAALLVGKALSRKNDSRDLMTQVGLWGVDLVDLEVDALAAARDGDIGEATSLAADITMVMNNATRSGGLRLAGIVFFGVAVFGVLGLWLFFRRERKPPWARSSRPPWAKKGR
jgi:hypothetical protein